MYNVVVTSSAPLPDGSYDAIVLDATTDADSPGVHLELTVLDGEHKGAVVEVATDDIDDDPITLLGIPATLTVTDGHPAVTLEP